MCVGECVCELEFLSGASFFCLVLEIFLRSFSKILLHFKFVFDVLNSLHKFCNILILALVFFKLSPFSF